jgi:hypothetical protein
VEWIKDPILTVTSPADAERLLLKVEADRASGLVIDYTDARHGTFAQLAER